LSRFPIEKLRGSAEKEDKSIESFLATFTSRDSIYGICKHSDEGFKLGARVLSVIDAQQDIEEVSKPVATESNYVGTVTYEHPLYDEHMTRLL